METGDLVPAVGVIGALGIRRSTISVLSSGIVDAGRGDWRLAAMEICAECLHLAGTVPVGMFDVSARATLLSPKRRSVCRGPIHRESLLPCHCVLAQCLCRIAGGSAASPVAVAGAANPRERQESAGATIAGRGRGVADKRTVRGDVELLAGVVGRRARYKNEVSAHT